MKPYYGEQAFPQKEPLTGHCCGMSLRDYFAAKAMQGMIVNAPDWDAMTYEIIAKCAYAMADVMLKATEEGK